MQQTFVLLFLFRQYELHWITYNTNNL